MANSYMNPAYAGSSLSSLVGLQPILGDLLTTSTPANSYLAPTYTGDTAAIADRLKDYQFYDTSKLEGLSDYFKSRASGTYNGSLAFRPEDFTNVQNSLGGLSTEQIAGLGDILKNLNPVGTMGGNTYYEKSQLENALSGYKTLAADAPEELRNSLGTAVGTYNSSPLYRAEDLTAALENYARANPSFSAASLGQGDRIQSFIDKINSFIPDTKEEVYSGFLAGNDPASLGYDKVRYLNPNYSPYWNDNMFGTTQPKYLDSPTILGENGIPTGEQLTPEYYREVENPQLTPEEFWSRYGATPEGGWSDANTKTGGYDLENNPLQNWLRDQSALPNFSLYGSGSAEDIQKGFNILQRMSPQNIDEFWYLPPEVQRGMLEHPAAALLQMKALENPANHDWFSIGAEGGFNTIGAYNWDDAKGLTADPSQYMKIHGGNSWTKPLSMLGTVLSFTPLAPLGVAMNVAAAAGNHNPLQAFASVLPMTGLGGALGGGLNDALGLGLGKAGIAALGSGLVGAGMGALGGGLQGALTGGLLGGAGGYAGSTLGDYMQGASPFAQLSANAALKGGLGALSAGLKGRNIGQGALGGLSSGVFSGVTNPAVRQALLEKLYS